MIFWDVDTQIDFMDRNGRLYVPGAESIIPNLSKLTQWAKQHHILVVASMCAHQKDDPEFQQYPPHCLVGTAGQKKIPETLLASQFVIPTRPVDIPKDLLDYDQVIVEKQQLDVFTNPNAEALLAAFGTEREIVLYGVVTEICVACAASGLLDRGYRVTLLQDAVRHLDDAKANATLTEIGKRGATIVNTLDVM